ncbi:MAG: hypothetical protein WA051_02835 [Minisyncoccia bacterium]
MTETVTGFSDAERVVLDMFVEKHLPRTTSLNEHPQILVVNQTDWMLPYVMGWIHEHSPAIASIPTAEVMFNMMDGRSQKAGNDKILQIALEVVERLFTMKDKNTFRLGYNVVLILRGEYMNIVPEVEKLVARLEGKFELYTHPYWT